VNAQEQFELVRETWATFNRQEMDAALARLHPEIEIVPFGAALEGRSYSGRDGVRYWLTEIQPLTWERFETIATDYRDAGDQLVVYGHWSARVRASGTEIEMPATWVIRIRDGLISRWETFTDRAEAHRSAGLGEET
jgi:ketosteroid isomerase-like protein